MSEASNLPPTYRVIHSCSECNHVFIRGEWDDPSTYYCTLRAPYRPHSMGTGERKSLSDKRTKERWRRWNEWAEGREVDGYCGTCDEWEPDRPKSLKLQPPERG